MDAQTVKIALLIVHLGLLILAVQRKHRTSLIYISVLSVGMALSLGNSTLSTLAFYIVTTASALFGYYGLNGKDVDPKWKWPITLTGFYILLVGIFQSGHLQGMMIVYYLSIIPIAFWLYATIKGFFRAPQWTFTTAINVVLLYQFSRLLF